MKLLALAVILAQTQTAPYVMNVEVRLHNIDVIVTNKDGKAVEGLTKNDFELLEDGKSQPITNFAAYADRVDTAPATTANGAAAPIAVPAPTRHFVFFVDEMSMHPMTRAKLASQATALLEQTMREGDQGTVIRPMAAGEKISLAFTSDRAGLAAALQQTIAGNTFRTNIAFETEMRAFKHEARNAASPRELVMIARRHATKVRRRIELRLATLRGIVASLSPIAGRKVLVTVTESLPAQPGREMFEFKLGDVNVAPAAVDTPATAFSDYTKTDYVDMTPLIEDIARTASSNGITIYALQPELDLKIDPSGGDTSLHEIHRAMANTGSTLDVLTKKTGGTWSIGDAHIADVLQQVATDIQSYYSLAYRAGENFDRPHKIEVRVRNHPDYKVRARNEVVRKSPRKDMNDRVVAALVTTDVPNELGIGVRSSPPAPAKKERGRYVVDVDVIVPLSRLTFLPDGDKQRARFTVHYAITSKDADFVNGIEPEQTVEIPVSEFAVARTKIWRHTLHVTLDKGKHQIAVGVLDGTSQTAGMAGKDLNIE